jgi:cytochrome c5
VKINDYSLVGFALWIACVACGNASVAAQDSKSLPLTKVPREKLAPFFETYCSHCHGSEFQEADVRFDKIGWEIGNNDQAQRWQDILDQLNGGDMPPKGEDQPKPEELAEVLDDLTKSVITARNRLTDHGGKITMRRLNRREYANTIYDLFGFDVALDDIPEDGEFESFDTVGAEQLFTSSDFEKYLELGKQIGERGFAWNTKRREKSTVKKFEVEQKHTAKLREKLADLDRKMEMKKAGKTWQEMGFKDEGEMEIVFSQFDTRAGNPRRYLHYPHIETGAYLSDVVKWVSGSRHTDVRGGCLVRIHGGIVGNPDEIRKVVRVSDSHGFKATLKLQGTPENPQTVQFRTRQQMGRSRLGIQVRENMPSFTANTTRRYLNRLQGKGNEYDPWSAIWVDYLEIEGPFYSERRSKLEELLYGDGKAGGKSAYFNNDATARDFIEKFAFEAFRRQTPDSEFVDALHQRFLANRKKGQRF